MYFLLCNAVHSEYSFNLKGQSHNIGKFVERIFRYSIRLEWYRFKVISILSLKGQSNEIFYLQFSSSFEPALATGQWVKIFSILIKNSQSYSNFNSENLTPRGTIPRRVRLPKVSYPGRQSPWGIIPWRVNLPGVSHPCKSISLGYHTPASQ